MASFTEKRRARLRKAVDLIERLETRSTITEPISVTALSVSALGGLKQLGVAQVHGGSDGLELLEAARQAALVRGNRTAAPAVLRLPQATTFVPIVVGTESNQGGAGASAPADQPPSSPSSAVDWLNLSPASPAATETGISTPWQPAQPTGGGAAMPPKGAPPIARGAVQPLRVAAPAQSATATNAAASGALLCAGAWRRRRGHTPERAAPPPPSRATVWPSRSMAVRR